MDSNMKSVLRNYIKKCGEGRGLDKFLRRNSFSSADEKDSNQSSLTISKTKSQTKSLESLNEPIKSSDETKATKSKTPPKSKEQQQTDNKSMEAPKVVVKQCGEKVDKKKSFNYESIIEITLPQQQSFPQHFPTPTIHYDKSLGEENKIEEPIKPIISCTPKIPSHACESDKKISPSSGNDESFVSNKQNPMEWDSYLPGYEMDNSHISMQLCNPPVELDEKELNALKIYFQQRDLELPNENLIVVIKNRKEREKLSENDRQFEHIRRNKEKWQNIYEKYKEKYHQPSINFQDLNAQSTPKVQEATSSSKQSKVIVMNEKSSQTSLIKSSVKSIQVESTSTNQKNIAQQTTMNTIESAIEDQFETYQNHSEIAESFEFMQGSLNNKNQRKESISKQTSSSNVTEAGSSKNSGISVSTKNEDISNFDDSLKVAIALLNSLLESKMRPELKRNLAEKVIQKIVQMQTSRSIQTSTLDSSNFYARSQSNVSQDENKSVKEKVPRSKSREEALKNCLAPMTRSEITHQSSQDSNKDTTNKDSTSNKSSIPKNQLMNFVKREKQTQLKWIEKEIEHLNNLRDLLKRSETPLSINESCPIYENMLSTKTKNNSTIKKDENEMKPPTLPPPSDTNFWNSHANMKKSKNRSKLETPHSSDPNVSQAESLASFIDSRNRRFLEKYKREQNKMYDQANANVYTHPFSSESKKPSENVNQKRRHTQMTAHKDVQTSTSLASSSVFESSDSMSVPINTNSKTTTHYQAESFACKDKMRIGSRTKQKVAVTQTTDSICRTKPIYVIRDNNVENCGTANSVTTTKRVNKIQIDKESQAHPPSIKYTLTFDKKSKPKMRPYASLPQKSNDYPTISKSSKDIYNQISYSASLNYYYDENKENYDNDVLFDDDNDEDIDLQKCFNNKRPEIFTRFEQRKKCIEELKRLRSLRNEHRAKLLLLTSEKSLEGRFFSSLPDLPLNKRTRIFSTKALKQHTKKVVNNLNEVQQRKKDENLKNLKRKTRLMAEIFNRNLQKNVLKGNLNLSNTVNLITK